ncbi:MAG: hypothetical protein ACLR3R_18705 [Clostridium paraputrificum]
MSIRKTIVFTEEQVEAIENIRKIEGISFGDVVRQLCDKALSENISEKNTDFIADILEEVVSSVMKPHVERLASISAKGAIMSATSTFLNAQALSDFVPVDRRRDFANTYEKARLKGIAYVKGKATDSEKEVQEAIKEEVMYK